MEKNESNCKYVPNRYLALTLRPVQQIDNGMYVCKVQTNTGHNSKEFVLQPQGGFHRNRKHNSKSRNTPTPT